MLNLDSTGTETYPRSVLVGQRAQRSLAKASQVKDLCYVFPSILYHSLPNHGVERERERDE